MDCRKSCQMGRFRSARQFLCRQLGSVRGPAWCCGWYCSEPRPPRLASSRAPFLASFVGIYLLTTVIITLGSWTQAAKYNLEPPLVALVVGLLLANLNLLPRSLDAGFRVEFYIKTGIVLLGATLPLNLIVWAGPPGDRAGLDHLHRHLPGDLFRRAAPGARPSPGRRDRRRRIGMRRIRGDRRFGRHRRASKEVAPIAITLVILWAIVMIFVLPLVARALRLADRRGGRLDRQFRIRRRRGHRRRADLCRLCRQCPRNHRHRRSVGRPPSR